MTVFCFGMIFNLASTNLYLDLESKFPFPNYLDLFEAKFIDFIIACVDAFGDTKLLGNAIELFRLFNSVSENVYMDFLDCDTPKLFLCLLKSTTLTRSLLAF